MCGKPYCVDDSCSVCYYALQSNEASYRLSTSGKRYEIHYLLVALLRSTLYKSQEKTQRTGGNVNSLTYCRK